MQDRKTILAAVLAVAAFVPLAFGQAAEPGYPHVYPGMPTGDYSPEWQSYFEVTEPLPNVTWTLPRSFAGNINVDREGHPNNTLFFWGFESTEGSLTTNSSNEPWGIWLNGGPGAASLLGLLYENGPIHIDLAFDAYENPYAWNTIADYIWIDQPVGVGWSTCDEDGFVADEDQMGQDFVNFLANLVKVFPSLATRPLYLTGESYAGTYIPYITKAIFSTPNPPVNLAKIAIGDGTLGSDIEFELLPVTWVIQTYPQLIAYDPAVYESFVAQEHICGYDLNLTYPQNGHFPTLGYTGPTDAGSPNFRASSRLRTKSALFKAASERYGSAGLMRREDVLERRERGRRELLESSSEGLNPWYGCDVYDEIIDYALNYSYPWNVESGPLNYNGFDVYQAPDALDPEVPLVGEYFFNNASAVAALHAPTSKQWIGEADYCFLGGEDCADPSVEPMAFLSELASNATARGVKVVIYSGNDDTLVSHRSSEVTIQNTTFGGIQGFTLEPATPWYNDQGGFAGIVHQERNWTYVLINGAGHLVADNQPAVALTLLREFILGNNTTGLVTEVNGQVTVIGGEDTALKQPVLPGGLGIFTGSGSTQGTYTYPTATIEAWSRYIATATAGTVITPAPTANHAVPSRRMPWLPIAPGRPRYHDNL